MNRIYFEAKGESLLSQIGMTKSEFARRMGIRKQNVKSLFKTKNIETIYKAAKVMDVPFNMLIGYTEEPDLDLIPLSPDSVYEPTIIEEDKLISEDDIPTGDSAADRRIRQRIIHSFYHTWKQHNPESKRYNLNLKEYINIRYVSIEETAGQASLTYLSTLAVLQLDAILTCAVLVETTSANHIKKNQKDFKRMLRMTYICPGLGLVKMMVGVKHSDNSKVQYCITAIATEKRKQEVK